VFQRAELAALRAKREQEQESKRAEAKRDKLFVDYMCYSIYVVTCIK